MRFLLDILCKTLKGNSFIIEAKTHRIPYEMSFILIGTIDLKSFYKNNFSWIRIINRIEEDIYGIEGEMRLRRL